MSNFFWLTFSCIKGVGNITVKELYFQHPYVDFDLIRNSGFLKTLKPSIKKFLDEELIEEGKRKALKILEAHKEKNIDVISIDSEYYPIALKYIKDPPSILYAKGNIEILKSMDMIAVVGTREPTTTGIHASRRIASTFVNYGYTIVSGLALGIDTAGHEGALRIPGGKTIAVMAGDLTKVYPAKNKKLAQCILDNGGLLLSEIAIGQSVNKGNFVKRDRIQSGLSLGICPVQTPLKSGTQHTIQFAREQERLIFTPIVMDIDLKHNASQGNLQLLNEKGVLVLENQDSYPIIINKMNSIKSNISSKSKELKNKKRSVYENSKDYIQDSLF